MPIFSVELLQQIQSNDPTVTELICSQVYGVVLTSQQVEDIATALQNNTHLKTISFLGNPINTKAAQLLAQFFANNTELKQVYLGTCNLRSNVSIILEPLKNHPSVELLDLNTNNLGDADEPHISSLLKNNSVLEELEVGDNKFTTIAYEKMGDALKANSELAGKLDFSSIPEQYFESQEQDIINESRAFCESQKMRSGLRT